ncbi:DUF2971 domain-containing protein [Methanolobus bombayensis]|uniref:DUF2971 domain-containing protein n=1 Tax=Methanolobus bombayensis TaxID=38023 RepID=UPI001AE2A7A8|nr:DUF2971 domain-containing protein [Methanolobus bombayensis]MBP1908257.1 hypothetical protein [Methanolobus bombayensis]
MVNDNPNIFYKYRSVNENTIKMLENQELYFSGASDFNDPFDSKADLIWRGNKDDWMSFLYRMGIKNHAQREQSIKENLKNGSLRNRKGEYLLDPNRTAFKVLKGNIQLNNKPDFPRACCFSEDNDSILMWSHYADEHKGICLCFKSKIIETGDFLYLDSNPDPYLLFPITYQEDMPEQVNMLSSYEPEELVSFLCTKHFDWKYEKERRLIMWPIDFNTHGQYTKKFRKEDLEGIIFGLNTPTDHIKMIKTIIDEQYLKEGFKVNFYKAQELQKKYGIYIKPIDDLDKHIEKYC